MLFIYFINLIQAAELYTVRCKENEVLNLYTYKCINYTSCPANGITYNQTTSRCNDDCPINEKCYLDPSDGLTKNYSGLNPYSRCTLSGYQDMESCHELINDWSINYYRTSSLGQMNCQECAFYEDFHSFSSHFSRSFEIETNVNVPVEYRFSSILTFILSRFDLNGSFLGFKEVTVDLTRCGEKNDLSQIWRRYGTNYYSDCNFNVPVANDSAPNEFYDMHLLYTNQGAQELMRVPVLIRNAGRNTQSDSANYQLNSRFFLKFSNSSKIQYAKNVTLQITIDPSNSHQIKVPLLIIQYDSSTISTSELINYKDVQFEKTSSSIRDFHFSVVYLRDMSSFWKQCLIILIVFMVISLIVCVVRCVIYSKHHKDDGTTIPYFFAVFCSTFGTALAFVTFICTFFLVFVFYKFQKQGYMCLPPESEFWFISVIVWIAFGLMFIASVIRVFLQTRANITIIDWETPFEQGAPVSAWRRLMISNEFNRIVTIRSYSLNITIVFLLFLLEGLNLTLLSAPIPRTELIDVGKTYKVLHFGFTSFLWIILMIVETVLNYLVLIKLGNPFINFIDLCATANCSVLIMNTQSQGYYIHGRSCHEHTDVDMVKLNENMLNESRGNVGLRGLVPNTNNQVFHVYLENDFAYVLSEMQSGNNQRFDKKLLNDDQKASITTSKEVLAMGAYDSLNKSLCRFFDGEECPYTYVVQNSTIIENALCWGPQVGKESVLTIQNDFSYRQCLISGIEWTLNVMYLILFAGIEMETRSPAIAAFVVFIVDTIFMAFYSRKSRINLSKKAIVDIHYLIS